MPAHHNAEDYLDAYIAAAGIAGEPKKPPSSAPPTGKTGQLTGRPLRRNNALDMVKRRAMAAGFPKRSAAIPSGRPASPPILRKAAPSSTPSDRQPRMPKTTKLYDRTSDQIDLDEIERIRI